MKCSKCGRIIPDDSAFCRFCGSKVVRELECICPECGKENPVDSLFCRYCGSPIEAEDSELEENDFDDEASAGVSAANRSANTQDPIEIWLALQKESQNQKPKPLQEKSVTAGMNAAHVEGFEQNKARDEQPQKSRKLSIGWIIAIAIVIIVLVSIPMFTNDDAITQNAAVANSAKTPTEQTVTYSPVSVSNGFIFKHFSGEGVAPFEVETRYAGGYYVYMKSLDSSQNDFSFYIVGGETVEMDVPLGSYEMYYATGNTWYGQTHYFGEETSFNKCDTILKFYIEGDYVNGHTIVLYLQPNGNLGTESINESQFPG